MLVYIITMSDSDTGNPRKLSTADVPDPRMGGPTFSGLVRIEVSICNDPKAFTSLNSNHANHRLSTHKQYPRQGSPILPPT